MSKLEEKLQELGYKLVTPITYMKNVGICNIFIVIGTKNTIRHSYIGKCDLIHYDQHYRTQDEINNLQQAFNEMKNDLEELKKYEEIYNKTN